MKRHDQRALTRTMKASLPYEFSDEELEGSAMGPVFTLGACTGLACPGCVGSPVPSVRRKRQKMKNDIGITEAR